MQKSSRRSTICILIILGPIVLTLYLAAVAISPFTFAPGLLQSVRLDRTIEQASHYEIRLISTAALFGACVMAISATFVWLMRDRLLAWLQNRTAARKEWFESITSVGPSWWFQLGSLLVIMLAGTLFRIGFLNEPIGFDEAITYVFFASRSLNDVLSDYAVPNNHILHTLLMHMAAVMGAASPALLRLPALIAGVCLIPAAFWLSERLFEQWEISVMSAALVAVAPAVVEYSVQARGYTLGALLFVVSFVAMTYVREASSRVPLGLFIIASALSLYTTPSMGLGVGIPCIWLFLSTPREARWRTIQMLAIAAIATSGITLLLYLPAIVRSGWAAVTANTYVRSLPFADAVADNIANVEEVGRCWNGALPSLAVWPMVSTIAIPFATSRFRRPAGRLLVASLLWILVLIVANRVAPPPRTLHFLFPLFAMLLAAGFYEAYVAIVRSAARPTIWLAVVLTLTAGWAGARISRGGFGWSEQAFLADAIHRHHANTSVCQEPNYADAAAIVDRFTPDVRKGSLLTAYVFSGVIETVQFELLRHHLPPVAIRPYRDSDNLSRLSDSQDVLVIMKPIAGRVKQPNLYELLKVDSVALLENYDPPQLVASFIITDVYRLHRKTPPDKTPRPRWYRIDYPR